MLPLQHKKHWRTIWPGSEPEGCIEALWEGPTGNIRLSIKVLRLELELEGGMLQTHIDGGPHGD
jgi:hypothetical protein